MHNLAFILKPVVHENVSGIVVALRTVTFCCFDEYIFSIKH